MAGILVYALHDDEGNSTRTRWARSPRPRGWPASSAARRRRWSSATSTTPLPRASATTAPPRSTGPSPCRRASPSRSSTRWRRSSPRTTYGYALFGGGLLGFEIGAGLTARLDAGVTMEVTAVKVAGRQARRRAPGAPGLGHRRRRLRLRARHHHRPPERIRREGERLRAAEVVDVEVELSEFSTRARMVTRGESGDEGRREHRGRRHPGRQRPRVRARRRTSSSPRTWPRPWAARSRRPARSSTPAGTPTPPRSGRRARPSRRSCTWAAGISGAIQHKVGMQNSEDDPRDQQGPERADLRVLRSRRSSAISTRSCRS